jgi:hypothetical protein
MVRHKQLGRDEERSCILERRRGEGRDSRLRGAGDEERREDFRAQGPNKVVRIWIYLTDGRGTIFYFADNTIKHSGAQASSASLSLATRRQVA